MANRSRVGPDNTPEPHLFSPVAQTSLFPLPHLKKQILSSARPDTFAGIGIFQHEGHDDIVTIPFSRGFFLLSLSFRPP
ncbi:hypothetical protein BO83DRAFT_377751 [Aspergillus eucalypticola CBS 122712]|uniref:Uncharacterized protein n=1 Tax=Aspergillus eucalypticola (strain CBS 122712 / IBT 29274) TaxID=1448314 RepID=A0A317VLI5_ASPEC|nr:uncharacterized protein BO83DRAFT_377751 [Aspergillus eucalypticola CBS 122712]PWY74705.1 hypothetical protein BO83DRAFT_377751 [Aspergillus eucalypticola CBS 122712]